MARIGKFVALEGIDGTGKSTQAPLLAAKLDAVLVREPGGTPLGEQIRGLLLDERTGNISSRAEALLFLAARAELVEKVVWPALKAGRHVVADRFSGSTLAYQGAGRGLAEDELSELDNWATDMVRPDLVVYLALPPDELAIRVRGRAADRMSADQRFLERVRHSFESQLANDRRWVVVDGRGTIDEVADRIFGAVQRKLRQPLGAVS